MYKRQDLTFIVDSDDWLKPNAIETVLRYYGKFWDRNGLCGYSFLRVFPDEMCIRDRYIFMLRDLHFSVGYQSSFTSV